MFKEDWGNQVNCPFCGCENVHFEKPEYKKTDEGDAWAGRGDAINITFWCENGCSWKHRFGFHKGLTFQNICKLA
jgi:hypothetical protein